MCKSIFFVILILGFIGTESCNKNTCHSISIKKLKFHGWENDTVHHGEEDYAAKCIDMNDFRDVDTLNYLIAKSYKRNKAQILEDYIVVVLKYDTSTENGFNDNSDYSQKNWDNTMNEHHEWFLAKYIWFNGKFDSMYILDNGKLKGIYVNMDSLANLK